MVIEKSDFTVVLYSSKHFEKWNEFVDQGKNATFLFHRNFLEYHLDRFEDFSLMVFKKLKLVAVLPANKIGNELFSHQGLSYGGLVFLPTIKFREVVGVVSSVLDYLKDNSIGFLEITLPPFLYHSFLSNELEYLMHILSATLTNRQQLSVIDYSSQLKIDRNRLEGYKKGVKNNLIVKEESAFDSFWNQLLIVNLEKKFHTRPTHSLEEISRLHTMFPKNIRQFNMYYKDEIVAGTTIFETEHVAHTQYISGSKKFNHLGGLDYLQCHLINEVFSNKKYFDFGSSHPSNDKHVNSGLHFWKEGFGARSIVQNTYKIEIKGNDGLNNLFV
ncbi:MAG: GNAT family N-acetyltransferase [Flavobacteriaceae bacterium]|nr:GNAT family N-acetyltransferase [Flavobacteriaceae bacterium]MDG2314903.1 GNAT family N-acetyltransferase [Flavobacteriaceae bacterium]